MTHFSNGTAIPEDNPVPAQVEADARGPFLHYLTNALTLAALAGFALVGHRTDWRFGWRSNASEPSYVDSPLAVTVEDESVSIVPEAAEWCLTHEVAHCPLCNPQLAQVDPVPEVVPADLERIRAVLSSSSRSPNRKSCSLVHHRLRLESAEIAEKLGIEVSPAWITEMSDSVAASGETTFDPTRVAHLSARTAGAAWRVMKRLGQAVHKGEVVALVESAEVGKAKAALLQSLVQLRLKIQAYDNSRDAPVSEQRRREARAELRDAEARVLGTEQELVNLGLPVSATELADLPFDVLARRLQRLGLPEEFSQLDDESIPGTLFPIVSPVDGTVAQCDLVAGEVVDSSRTLFTIADASRLVLTLQVAAGDASRIEAGQRVRFRPDGAARETTTAVGWVAAAAKERTRTVPVRSELENRDGHLLASLFGRGWIVVRHEPNAIVVPNEALQTDGDCALVFVRDKDFLRPGGPKVFHIRSVRTGAKDDRNTEIVVGVLPGEVVVTQGSDVLLGVLLRTRNHQRLTGDIP